MLLKRLVDNSRKAIDGGVYDVAAAGRRGSGRDLLETVRTNPRATLITEVKFSSPSLGEIRAAGDPAGIAGRMVGGGASAVSVLTQPHLFNGSPGHFLEVRDATDAPMLMKDIVIDKAQVDAGRRIGADYILLIQSLFDRGHAGEIDEMVGYCHGRGLGVLLEVHTEGEMASAQGTEADIIGINNRDLDTLEVDIGATGRILAACGKTVPVVSESGISTPRDIRLLRGWGADAFLIGSSIMRSGDVEGRVRELVNAY